MGWIVFVLLAGAEICFMVWSCKRGNDAPVWRRQRLIVRAGEIAIVVITMLLPFGQKWRFVPSLVFLLILLVIPAASMLIRRNATVDGKKPSRAIVSCVLCILFLWLLLVPAFVFTGYSGLPVSGEYQIGQASAILVDDTRTDPFETDGSFREVPVHFYYPLSQGSDTGGYPLVLFSHGAFGYYQSNTSTYMELASNGYVVLALDHPHHAFFTEDTEGKTVLVDQDFINKAMSASQEDVTADSLQEQFETYQTWMGLRMADMGFVLDEVKAAGQQGALDGSWFPGDNSEAILAILGKTDFSKIGLMGHSMGGATSVGLGRERNDVTAVIDLDGTMLSEYTGIADGALTVCEEPYLVPVLEFVNWETYNELADNLEAFLSEGGSYPNDALMRHAAAGYSTTIRDTKHMDFTDLPLLSPVLGNLLGSGTRDHAETMTIVNSLVLQFFDCYLKGEGVFAVQDCY